MNRDTIGFKIFFHKIHSLISTMDIKKYPLKAINENQKTKVDILQKGNLVLTIFKLI